MRAANPGKPGVPLSCPSHSNSRACGVYWRVQPGTVLIADSWRCTNGFLPVHLRDIPDGCDTVWWVPARHVLWTQGCLLKWVPLTDEHWQSSFWPLRHQEF